MVANLLSLCDRSPIAGENVSIDIFSTMLAQRLNKPIQWAMAHEACVIVRLFFINLIQKQFNTY